MDRFTKTRRAIWVAGLLSAVTLASFWPVFHNDFIKFDDPDYVTANPHVATGLTWENVGWAFRSGHAANWHPLTWLSHMLDVQMFGLRPGWHHLTSLLIHTANALLLFMVLRRMTGAEWRSAFVAGFFAVHPLHVESVAWVAERKDVLSTFFFLLTLWAYVRYAEGRRKNAEPRPRSAAPSTLNSAAKDGLRRTGFTFRVSPFYLVALLFFVLGLMSKPMLVTLPFVLLLAGLLAAAAVRTAKPNDFGPAGMRKNPLPLPGNSLQRPDVPGSEQEPSHTLRSAVGAAVGQCHRILCQVPGRGVLAGKAGDFLSAPQCPIFRPAPRCAASGVRPMAGVADRRCGPVAGVDIVGRPAPPEAAALACHRMVLVSGHAGSSHRHYSSRRPGNGGSLYLYPANRDLPVFGLGRRRFVLQSPLWPG